MAKVSILITAFLRPHLLKWNLISLTRQKFNFDLETIVLNDGLPDETEALCQEYEKQLNLKYVFTGQRNLKGEVIYRVPGFALNIGAKRASGEILIISCAEMFHLNHTINHLAIAVSLNRKHLSTAIGMDDDGSFLDYLNNHNGEFDFAAYLNNYPRLNTRLPFLMGIHRDEFFAINGYDEDFTGFAYDDNDLMDRLSENGCRLCLTQALTIHLYHPRHDDDKEQTPEYLFNQNLYRERQGRIIRNLNREWGQVDSNEEKLAEGEGKSRVHP
jgi:glycosyltransferase involved in cell wall biosynthesis